MELILKKDLDNVGFKDDLVVVKNGYGRNFLIPKGYGVLATPSAKKILAENLRQRAHKEEKLVAQSKEQAAKLKELEIKIISKSGPEGKLFGSVNNTDLSLALEKNSIMIDKKFIKIIGGTIKQLGKYTATVRFHREVTIDFNFEVAVS